MGIVLEKFDDPVTVETYPGKYFQRLASEKLDKVVETFEEYVADFRNEIGPDVSTLTFLRQIYLTTNMSPLLIHSPHDIAVMRTPDLIKSGPAYTVSSTLAAEALDSTNLLRPPFLFEQEKIVSHRNKGIHLATALMSALGIPLYGNALEVGGDLIDLGHKDSFLYASYSGFVDPESYHYENMIGQMGIKADELLINALVKNDRLRPELSKIMQSLIAKKELTPSQLEYIDGVLLPALNMTQGIRQFWYRSLEALLKGRVENVQISDPSDFELRLWKILDKYPRKVEVSEAAIIKFYPMEATRHTDFLLAPIGTRVLDKGPILPVITPKSVSCIYTLSGAQKFKNFPCLPMSHLPRETFLRNTPPSQIDPKNLSPTTAMCRARYPQHITSQAVADIWLPLLKSGKAGL
jgi:hypothetical protein